MTSAAGSATRTPGRSDDCTPSRGPASHTHDSAMLPMPSPSRERVPDENEKPVAVASQLGQPSTSQESTATRYAHRLQSSAVTGRRWLARHRIAASGTGKSSTKLLASHSFDQTPGNRCSVMSGPKNPAKTRTMEASPPDELRLPG